MAAKSALFRSKKYPSSILNHSLKQLHISHIYVIVQVFARNYICYTKQTLMNPTKKLLIIASIVLATVAYAGKQWQNRVLQHPSKPCSKTNNVANCQYFDKYTI
ncbi:MAG: hypothetical protein ACOVNY_00810 [Chitinophagaceae bacterium]|jgi:phosphatidylserine synthase